MARLQNSFERWLTRTLEESSEWLNGLPVCPYAREARTKKLIRFYGIERPAEFFSKIESHFSEKLEEEVLVFALQEYSSIETEALRLKIREWREILAPRDMWVMSDHPGDPEVFGSMSFNHGGLLLVFIQRLSKLVSKSQSLDTLGYYKNWPKDYYDKVVGLRKAYHEKYVVGSERPLSP